MDLYQQENSRGTCSTVLSRNRMQLPWPMQWVELLLKAAAGKLVWSKQRGMEPESLSPRADWLYWGWGGGLVQHRVSRLSCGSWWQQQRLVPAFPIMGPCVLQHSNFCQFSQVGLLHSWFHCVLARLVAKGSADGRIASPRKQGWAGFYFLVLLELQDPPHLMSAVEWQPKSRARCKIVAKKVNSSLLCPIRYLL